MDIFLIIANIFGIGGWLFLILSYYKKNINELIVMQIISSILYIINYILLGAYAGTLISLFELTKEILYFKSDKDTLIFYVTLPVYAIIGYYTCNSFLTFIPIVASIIDGFGITINKNIATICGTVGNFLWVIYDASCLAYSSALTDAIIVLSNLNILIMGYSRLLRVDKFHILKCNYLSSNILSKIEKLDEEVYGENYIWNKDYQKRVFEKNKDSLLLIKYKKEIVGYIDYLVIDEDFYNKILRSKKYNNDFNIKNIRKFYKSKKNYLIINDINVKKIYQNNNSIKVINNKIKNLIHLKYIQGYSINGIICYAVNEFEENVLEYMDFKLEKEFDNNEKLYSLDKKIIDKIYLTKEYRMKEELKKYRIVTKVDDELLNDSIKIDKQFNNDNLYIIMLHNNKLIGYIDYIGIIEEKYNEIKNSNKTIDNYKSDDIVSFKKTKRNYIKINSIEIVDSYQNTFVVSKLINRFKKEIKALNKKGYKIYGITTTSYTKDGYKCAYNFGFIENKKLDNNNYLFLLEGENLKKFLK